MKAIFICKWRGIEPALPLVNQTTGLLLQYSVKTECPDQTVIVEVDAPEATIRAMEQAGIDNGVDSDFQHLEDIADA